MWSARRRKESPSVAPPPQQSILHTSALRPRPQSVRAVSNRLHCQWTPPLARRCEGTFGGVRLDDEGAQERDQCDGVGQGCPVRLWCAPSLRGGESVVVHTL